MAYKLPADCLNEVFEYLEKDKISLRSCLLVNRLWCEVSVRILWRDVLSFGMSYKPPYQSFSLLSTLIACLPNESKNLLYVNGIFIPTPASKPPFLNYTSFIRILSIYRIDQIINDSFLKNQQTHFSQSLACNKYLVSQELLKTFMNQISSLKSLHYDFGFIKIVPFTYFPEPKDCLTDLSIFSCASDIYPEFFYQLSQKCHNIQTLTIGFRNYISNGLKELISLQNNLKDLTLSAYDDIDWLDIIPALTKHHNTLTKLRIHVDDIDEKEVSLSFIASFKNLQELVISFLFSRVVFNKLQHVIFSNLKILKIPFESPGVEILMSFLENNGKNLNELDIEGFNKSLKLSIVRFCPNLKRLSIIFENDQIDILKDIFNGCQYLESIKVYCGNRYLNEKELLEVVAKCSPKNFYELKMYNYSPSKLLSEDLESFFTSWGNRISQKPLTLITIKNSYRDNGLGANEKNITTIEKYKKLGIIRKFETEPFELEEWNDFFVL